MNNPWAVVMYQSKKRDCRSQISSVAPSLSLSFHFMHLWISHESNTIITFAWVKYCNNIRMNQILIYLNYLFSSTNCLPFSLNSWFRLVIQHHGVFWRIHWTICCDCFQWRLRSEYIMKKKSSWTSLLLCPLPLVHHLIKRNRSLNWRVIYLYNNC